MSSLAPRFAGDKNGNRREVLRSSLARLAKLLVIGLIPKRSEFSQEVGKERKVFWGSENPKNPFRSSRLPVEFLTSDQW